jgi:endonuclease-3
VTTKKSAARPVRPEAKTKAAAPKKTAAALSRPEPVAAKRAAAKPKAASNKKPKGSPAEILEALRAQHPEAHCELDYTSPWTLLVATVLSAQTTDKLVNTVTPSLFERWPTPAALAAADPPDVGEHLRSRGMGFFNVKSKNIVKLAQQVVERHAGEVPATLADLVKLSGVGKKTANLILGECFRAPEGVVVDTHVLRVSQRLGLSKRTDAEDVSGDLAKLFPREQWMTLTHAVIFHGRRVCAAIAPACASCGASALCPSAFDAVNVGRKTR